MSSASSLYYLIMSGNKYNFKRLKYFTNFCFVIHIEVDYEDGKVC